MGVGGEKEAEARMKGPKKRKEKKKTHLTSGFQQGTFFLVKVRGQIRPPLVTAASRRASVNPGFTRRPPSRPQSLT